MALLRIFDYIYYRVYHIYKLKWNDSTPGAYATSLVTLLQSLLVVIIPIFIYELITSDKVNLSKIYYLVVFLLFFVFNYYRYYKVTSYENLAEKWNHEQKAKRKRKGIYMVVFIVVTIAICLTLATILGEINRGKM